MFTPRQTLIDTAELAAIETELAQLKRPADEGQLTEFEHQEAVGVLIYRTLENPNLIRQAVTPIDLGKYKAMVTVLTTTSNTAPQLRVKFIRT